jgi:DNA polymerase-3 subunit delta'
MIALETPELPASLELPSWLAASLAELLRQRERLPHALLIEGPAGIGKGLLASAFAAALLCESANHQRGACQRCPACGWYRSGNHPDFRRLSPKTDEEGRPEGRSERSRREIKIDQVRGLAEFVALGAHRAGRKIVIVEPASALNVTAANALLKTLEEPDRATLFLLVAARGAPVPATIRSRCVAFPVATPTRDQSLGWLSERLPAEERAGAQRWLDLADGAPLTALGFTEPGAATAHRLLLETVRAIPESSALKLAEGFGPIPAAVWLPQLQGWVADLGRVCAGGQALRHTTLADRLGWLAGRTDLGAVCALAAWLDRQVPVLEHPLNARLFAEDAWSRYEALFALRG